MKTKFSVLLSCLAWAGVCWAQNAAPAANTVVKADSLPVHAEASGSSDVVETLKKGEELVLGLELKIGTEKWCSIGRPGQARLGYVLCDGLERADRRAGDIAMPANATPSADASLGGPASPAGRPAVKLPPLRSATESSGDYQQVAAAVVHDGMLDGAKVAQYEQAAASGATTPMTRAAFAHYAAAQFELSHDDSNEALEQLRAALPFAAKQPGVSLTLLITLAYVHLVRAEYTSALEYIEQARKISPNSAAVAQLAGWADYGLSRLDDAIREWKTAQRLQPNASVAEALEKAERDKAVEAGAREGGSSHFTLRYQGSATPQLANEILRALEDDFRSLENDLHFTPPEPIGVILYTQQTFADITRAPSWMGALNDGRIRVPVQGLDNMNDDLARVLKHELTHSFLRQITLGRCPTWLQEGMAQWEEGRRSTNNAAVLLAAYDRGNAPPLEHLEGSWTRFPAPAAAFAYAWSLAAVESIMAKSGPTTMIRLLGDLNSSASAETALREALQMRYADLEKQTADYLRETYGQ